MHVARMRSGPKSKDKDAQRRNLQASSATPFGFCFLQVTIVQIHEGRSTGFVVATHVISGSTQKLRAGGGIHVALRFCARPNCVCGSCGERE